MVIHNKIVTGNNKRLLNESQMIGQTNGSLKVLSLDKIEFFEKPQKHRVYTVTVLCINCGAIFQCPWTSFRAKSHTKCKTCKFCMGKHMSEQRTKETGLTKWERCRLANIKSGAKLRNIDFCLSDQEVKFLLNQPCIYCGEQCAGGIDRIDSLKGYTKENVVSCCSICNKMKNAYSLEFFKSHIHKIYKNIYEN